MGMMDVREKEMESLSSVNDDVEKEDDEESKKCCVDCKTTKTPLWRGGPAGPKSLCNACGIRYRKRRISMISMNRGSGDRKKKKIQNNNNNGGELKIRLMGFGKGVILLKKQRRCQRRRMKFGEEEQQAAVSLMALSSSSANAGCSVFA